MNLEELQRSPLFRNITPEDLKAMLGCLSAREVAARRGGFIMSSPGEHPLMGVVLEGEVEMISEDYFGKKSLLSVLRRGAFSGRATPASRPATAPSPTRPAPTAGCCCWTMGASSTPASWCAGSTTG